MDFNEFQKVFQTLCSLGEEYQTFCQSNPETTEENVSHANIILSDFNDCLNSIKRYTNHTLNKFNEGASHTTVIMDPDDIKEHESHEQLDSGDSQQPDDSYPTSISNDDPHSDGSEDVNDSDPDIFVPKIYGIDK